MALLSSMSMQTLMWMMGQGAHVLSFEMTMDVSLQAATAQSLMLMILASNIGCMGWTGKRVGQNSGMD
jgi:hypothetical protein